MWYYLKDKESGEISIKYIEDLDMMRDSKSILEVYEILPYDTRLEFTYEGRFGNSCFTKTCEDLNKMNLKKDITILVGNHLTKRNVARFGRNSEMGQAKGDFKSVIDRVKKHHPHNNIDV